MKNQETVDTSEAIKGRLSVSKWSGLHTQMMMSYVVLTLVSVCVLELLHYILSLLVSLPPVPWYILLGVDIFLLIVVPLMGGLFGLISTRGLVHRIRRLATVTTQFADGDYMQRVQVSRRDEFGQLEEQFNRMAQQLIESTTQRQALAGQNARMAERDRIARDLHDSIKQQVFAVSMQLGAALSLLDQQRDVARQHLEQAESLAYEVQQELTTLIQELRPLALQDKELSVALQDLVKAWSHQQGIAVDLHISEACMLPLTIEEALWRVTQEAFSNIARHSQATKVQLSLECSQGTATLSIEDNGRGFDKAGTNTSGVGLHSMQERLEALGSTFMIESKVGEGTHILAQCPYTHIPTNPSQQLQKEAPLLESDRSKRR